MEKVPEPPKCCCCCGEDKGDGDNCGTSGKESSRVTREAAVEKTISNLTNKLTSGVTVSAVLKARAVNAK